MGIYMHHFCNYMLPREGHFYWCLLKTSLTMYAAATMVLAMRKDETGASSTKVLDHSSDQPGIIEACCGLKVSHMVLLPDPCDLLLEVILPLEVIY